MVNMTFENFIPTMISFLINNINFFVVNLSDV